jgi:ABC-type nickel/cobalt efflux system permease component RcnA
MITASTRYMRHTLSIVFALWLALALPVSALAHPLGNFTINHYAGLNVSSESITIDYVLDMAEIPAFQEIQTFDANGNGAPDSGEADSYHPAQCASIQSRLDLRVNDRPAAMTLTSTAIEFPAGAGGLYTLRLTCAFSATAAVSNGARVTFADHSYADRIGWREIVVTSEGVSLTGDLASHTQSVSNRLTVYPNDLLNSPLDQRQISFGVGSAAAAASESAQPSGPALTPISETRSDAFTQLIMIEELSLPVMVFALGVAFVWGAMHALTPGHGKTVVGAYLVGSRGTARHALYLGLTTTITHTLGVFALGLVTLFASQFILPEQLFPWLSFISGLLVVAIGVNLCLSRLRAATRAHGGHPHDHDHSHDEAHHHDHDHDHGHDHDHHHHHDGYTHSHLPPGAGGEPVTWRSILALGISGGLLPCPSALVVLLSAIALGRVGFGLVLVSVFSLGLAAVLTGIGLVLVYAGRLFQKLPTDNRLIRLIPAASAVFIVLAGLGITWQAVAQLRLLI